MYKILKKKIKGVIVFFMTSLMLVFAGCHLVVNETAITTETEDIKDDIEEEINEVDIEGEKMNKGEEAEAQAEENNIEDTMETVVEKTEDTVIYTDVEVKEGEYEFLIQQPNRGHGTNQPATLADFGMNLPSGWEKHVVETTDFEDKIVCTSIVLYGKDDAYLNVATVDTYVIECDYDNIYEEGNLFNPAGVLDKKYYIKEVEQKEEMTTKYGDIIIYSYVLESSVDKEKVDAEAAMFYVNGGRILMTYLDNSGGQGMLGYKGILKNVMQEIF